MNLTGPPRARPAASVVAVVSAALLIVLAVVAVRDLAVAQGWASGRPWLPSAVDSLDGLAPGVAVIAVGVVAALVGLFLVLVALAPAPATHVAARSEADLWLSPRAVAELARDAADRTSGVSAAAVAKASRRRVVLDVAAAPDATDATQRAEQALDAGVRTLTSTRVVVRAKEATR